MLLINLLSFSSIALGEVYRWVDDKGKVHFGDRPQGTQAQKVKIKPPPPDAATSQDAPTRESFKKLEEGLLRGYTERKALEKKEQASKKKQKAERDRQCAKAQAEYDDYDGYRRYDFDEKGNMVFLSDKEISATKASFKTWLDKNCN